MIFRFLISTLVLAGLSGCGPTYSPDTYASNAAQQANKVEQGVVVGVRNVAVTAAGTVGAVTGAAAGGIAGAQVGVGPTSAFSALGGSLVGGLGGSAIEHVTADTLAYEYIVRKPNGDLVSVTQKDKTPLALGQKVLVIAGTQARVVPDYTVPPLAPKTGDGAKPGEGTKMDGGSPGPKPADAAPVDAVRPVAAQSQNSAPPATASPAGAQPSAGDAPATSGQGDAKPASGQAVSSALAVPAGTTQSVAASGDKPIAPAKPGDAAAP